MIIIRDMVRDNYTKVDRSVFTNRNLTDGAKVLYGYISGLPIGQQYNDKYILKALDISQQTLTRRKQELKKLDLILVSQVGPRNYVLFIGRTNNPASWVKRNWEKENDY